jgi:hypothetical protein
MGSSKFDWVTLLLRSAFKTFGAGHGMRLACGVVLGFALEGVRQASVILLAGDKLGLALEKATMPTAVAIGVLLAFLPLLFKKRVVTEDYSRAFDLMDEVCARGRIPDLSRRRAYEDVLRKVVDEFSPGKSVPITRIVNEVAQDEANNP